MRSSSDFGIPSAGMEVDTPVGGEDDFRSFCFGADVELPILDALTFRAEAWLGKALSDVRGGIGRSVNTTTGEEIESRGAWVEVVVRASSTLKLAFGATVDDPVDGDLPAGGRARNSALYAHAKNDWGGGLLTGLDVVFWSTEWLGTDDGDLLRFDLFLQLNF